jgi:hypothetical protein
MNISATSIASKLKLYVIAGTGKETQLHPTKNIANFYFSQFRINSQITNENAFRRIIKAFGSHLPLVQI